VAYELAVVVHIPVQVTTRNEDGDLVIRAEVRVPANSWKRNGWPTDGQIEAALAVAFGRLEIERPTNG
jgi:hypothetical protein